MALTLAMDRQCSALIKEARLVIAEALSIDPLAENIDPAQLIARCEALRVRNNRLRAMITGVRTNAVNLRLRQSRRKAAAR